MNVQTITHFAGTPLFARLTAVRAQMAQAAAKRKVYRNTLTELQSLSTRDLNDLGIAPSDLVRIAHEAAYGA